MSLNPATVLRLAAEAGMTLATAESLTGGMVCASFVAVPGASAVVKGGIVAYDAAVKIGALGVSPLLMEDEGPVSQSVAIAMARGALAVLGADVAVATTGVAGPEAHGGHAPGTVVIAVVGLTFEHATTFHIKGNRDDVIRGAVDSAMSELAAMLTGLVRR